MYSFVILDCLCPSIMDIMKARVYVINCYYYKHCNIYVWVVDLVMPPLYDIVYDSFSPMKHSITKKRISRSLHTSLFSTEKIFPRNIHIDVTCSSQPTFKLNSLRLGDIRMYHYWIIWLSHVWHRGPLGTNADLLNIKEHIPMKSYLKISSAKCCPFCYGIHVLIMTVDQS